MDKSPISSKVELRKRQLGSLVKLLSVCKNWLLSNMPASICAATLIKPYTQCSLTSVHSSVIKVIKLGSILSVNVYLSTLDENSHKAVEIPILKAAVESTMLLIKLGMIN